MSAFPKHQAGNFRHSRYGTIVFIQCPGVFARLVHLVGTVVGHSVRCIADSHAFCIQPAVALDETDTVCGTAAKPVFLNKIGVVSYTVRILLFFVLKEGRRKNISISAPYVAPVVRPCLYGIGRKIQIVLCTGINKAGYIDFIIVAAAILYITGIRAVAAVAWLVSLIVGLVLVDGIALFKCL